MADPTRIVILGGGFAGVLAARRLERLYKKRSDIQVTLISRDNFLLMTPLMFEACTGTLELRHCSVSIRAFLRRTRFIEGIVQRIDLDGRIVLAAWGEQGATHQVPYDQLVLAMGAVTNTRQIPGSDLALPFKTLADVIVLRNHLIECLERADVETDPATRRRLLTLAVIGGGFVGSEVFGELTAFMDEIVRYYPRVRRDEMRLFLIQAGPHIMPEVPQSLADYAAGLLLRRPGVQVLTSTSVQSIEPGRVHLKDQVIDAETIVLSAGILPAPVVAELPLPKDHHGHLIVENTMRCKDRPEIWAIGDCASIPDPHGNPYPKLAQFAMRQAKTLADNLHAVLDGKSPAPFEFNMLGLMAALGHYKGLGTVFGLRVRGFFAWWLRRTYYLTVMPRWPQRIRIVADWTIALFFRPDISKVDLGREQVSRMRARS
ncbi:MAG: NAD(P)/FAD-dependent oxidoreductase [Tepidisphaeraceae bacterium]|jgi:NADH dehydrogenase